MATLRAQLTGALTQLEKAEAKVEQLDTCLSEARDQVENLAAHNTKLVEHLESLGAELEGAKSKALADHDRITDLESIADQAEVELELFRLGAIDMVRKLREEYGA